MKHCYVSLWSLLAILVGTLCLPELQTRLKIRIHLPQAVLPVSQAARFWSYPAIRSFCLFQHPAMVGDAGVTTWCFVLVLFMLLHSISLLSVKFALQTSLKFLYKNAVPHSIFSFPGQNQHIFSLLAILGFLNFSLKSKK